MKVKLAVLSIYGIGILSLAFLSQGVRVSAHDSREVQEKAETVKVLTLDNRGRREFVPFDHKLHEAELNPDISFRHQARFGVACTVCHHTVQDLTDLKQYRNCSDCHKPDRDPANNADSQGIELNSREIYHRLCIGCHVADVKAGDTRLVRYNANGYTKCKECHDAKTIQNEMVADGIFPPPITPLPKVARDYTPYNGPPVVNPTDKALGYAGRPRRVYVPAETTPDFVQRPDRWRIGFPSDPRFTEGSLFNPYRQNLLKGDYPIFGQHNFLVITAESETGINGRRLPVPSDVSAQNPNSEEFFGRGGQLAFNQDFIFTVELFHGDAAFKPVDWRIHITPVFNLNYIYTQENGIVNIDPRRGNTRTDAYISAQEAFGEYRLGDTTKLLPFLKGKGSQNGESPYFDTTSIRAGIQPFISDFRGFIFSDVNLGARLFGNAANNRYQFNAAYFNMLEKDTNSELNTPHLRNQAVFIANLFRQDTFVKGYTTEFSFHYNDDRPSRHFDENDFLVRPAEIGDVALHGVKVGYVGFTGDGHIGRLNINHAFYQAFGHDSHNPIAGHKIDINAQMAAAELSYDKDWVRFRGSFFWASGEKHPFGNTGHGFDSILDAPEFAGGQFSFWNSQGIRLTQTGVALVNPESLLPSLRSSKTEGQANFINPGIFIYNLAMDANLTQKFKAVFNVNYLRFQYTEPLEAILFQPVIRKDIGIDYGGGIIWRPLLSENVIVSAGFSSLIPGSGFKDIYTSNCINENCGAKSKLLYSGFVKLKFTY